jgi:hypothetical protein
VATITWGGGSGTWSFGPNWQGVIAPGSTDTADINGTGAFTVTLDSPAAVGAVTLQAGTLDLLSTLSLAGTLDFAGGTLALAGVLAGGMLLAVTPSSLLAEGGTLDGVVVAGGLTDLGGLTITAATAALNAASPITPQGTLTLANGSYDGETFELAPIAFGGGTAELDAPNAAQVTFGATTVVNLSDDAPGGNINASPSTGDAVILGGAGAIVNDGTILSNFANATDAALAIVATNFTNAGFMAFAPMMSQWTETVPVSRNKFGQPVNGTVDWTQDYAPTLTITSPLFVNSGLLSVSGGTITAGGAVFDNEGIIALSDAQGQALQFSNGIASIVGQTLATELDISVGVGSYLNHGTISADLVRFDGSIALPALGSIDAALDFAGTLDLGGGTLDASAFGTVTISGLVKNGSLLAGSGTLALDGATLDAVSLASGGVVTASGPITILDPPPSVTALTLDAVTTELGLFDDLGIGTLNIVAGSTQTLDTLALLGLGAYSFGSGVTLAADVAGSQVAISGFATLLDDGLIAVDGATVDIAPTLDGTATITIADGAAVTLEALAPTAALTVVFGSGAGLLVLPGTGAGLTIDGLHAGDLVDFTAVSDTQSGTLFVQPGAAIAGGALDVVGASGDTASVPVTNAASGLSFATQIDPNGGTLVTTMTACFREGTRIATPAGDACVERLAIGDTVLGADGHVRPIKWIGRRRYPGLMVARARHLRPVRIAPGALGPGMPRRFLEVSPEHALLIDGLLIPAGALVNGATITRAADGCDVCYVHIELFEHAVILAEGAAAETFVPLAGRALFDNAAEYARLYPDDPPPARIMPRSECGEAVERVRAWLARRAGIVDAPSAPGPLQGHVERIAAGILEGWACDAVAPERRLVFELLLRGRVRSRVVANRYRPDLDFHALPACGFLTPVPRGVPAALRRVSDGAMLPLAAEALAA